ncbi:hypothetical protein SAMN05661096_00884 [Marivirga sericea]|uniref:Uncharacterized protein n=1 Tax=Marivirga sericea TaxID=1028 RepID=A0A1X7IP08_9BACT|nr:hypothetical protein [Marivirga sericea]SMG16794.1 hypothetical protein SAMN05661096_00884 [Marivirga sericea]
MKKNNISFKSIFQKTAKYFFDFLVVFIGVFLAFWLNSRKEEQNKIDQQTQIYRAIYTDLKSFYGSGRVENPNGFIIFFTDCKNELDSLVAIKKVPPYVQFTGDYWQLEIINSLLMSGQLKDLDPDMLRALVQFNTAHQNFLGEIEGFNHDYVAYITQEYDKGLDNLYQPESNQLKETSKIPLTRLNTIIEFAESLVPAAKVVTIELNEEFQFEK